MLNNKKEVKSMPSNLSEKDLEFLKTDEEIINKNDDKPVKSVEETVVDNEANEELPQDSLANDINPTLNNYLRNKF